MRIYLVAAVLSLSLLYQVGGGSKHYLIETVDNDDTIKMSDDDALTLDAEGPPGTWKISNSNFANSFVFVELQVLGQGLGVDFMFAW